MKILITDKELAQFLVDQINHLESAKLIYMNDVHVADASAYVIIERRKKKFDLDKMRPKLKSKIIRGVEKDLKDWMIRVRNHLDDQRVKTKTFIHKNIDVIIDRIGGDNLLEMYRKSKVNDFAKNTGLRVDKRAELIRRKTYTNFQEDCLFRNMEGNEELLLSKMDNHLPFWFIDTGYTNFLNGKKKTWHRLTRNHLHHYKNFEAPVDRLSMFEFFPQQWRKSGEKILVIEPGSFSARTFNVDVAKWKQDVEREIRQYSDKPIVFREKYNKKIRTSLYNHLCDEDYHCVININSNAAVEAIWAGIPAITLATHITNPVSGSSISQINNLPKPHLANWLCMLSYSQFTYEELTNGVATRIIKRYYE